MISVSPIQRALVPRDSDAAVAIAGPNYDEFQSDEEIHGFITRQRASILKVTMPHCDAASPAEFLVEGSDDALARATTNMAALVEHELTDVVDNSMFIYDMLDPTRPDIRQIGLGCMARSDEIRTDDNPGGSIIRNEGIRMPKAEGRAALVRATNAFIGTVNLAVDDKSGDLAKALEIVADETDPSFEERDHKNNVHRIWMVTDADTIESLTALMAAEPHAYVADGNHRSAAANMLGYETFLSVIFIAPRMRIDPYHRLVRDLGMGAAELLEACASHFDVTPLDTDLFTPTEVHDIGFYMAGQWYKLNPKAGTWDTKDAVQGIDSDILQRNLYARVLGMDDPTDKRLNFVGGDKGVTWLKDRVDDGSADCAFALASVTMEQFVDVCLQGRYMPPKSTWFEPKIQSGLVVALL